MWLISRLRDYRYCAFCKTPRRVYVKKHVDLTNVVCAVLISTTLAFGLWGEPDPRGLGIFCVFIAGAEIFVFMRWRMAIICKMCGFDPALYKKSKEDANLKVQEFFKEQIENPQFWLTKSPLLTVQKQIRANEKKAIEREIISRRAKSSSLAPPKSM
jgi:hypothetical protein